MRPEQARRAFEGERVARLATVTPDGAPHLVPVSFAVRGDTVAIAVDHKPKETTALARLRNIRAEPRVCLLADRYDEDWTRLWWARADGLARVRAEAPAAAGWLAEKYAPYREHPPEGPYIVVEVRRWSGWSAASVPAPPLDG
ncbi:PPOX class F420-dependent oxidoreductase [Microtetraspora sp. NBRC 13810]|nr:PPOX class F420-dependent oxidoreductase [Microtetraspora sp. NBRC 13810]